MLLAVEIDNAHINLGVFEDVSQSVLAKSFKVSTDINKTSDEYAVVLKGIFDYYGILPSHIDGAIISSVVPMLTETVRQAVFKLFGEIDTLVVGKGTKTGFPIKIDNPSELGTDLVANAAAVIDIRKKENKLKTPCIIVDMGTATTVFALNAGGEYIGGCIIPGIGISLEVLHGKTAQLPNVALSAPTRAIGKNSAESVRSGVMLGNAIMIDGFIKKFSEEMESGEQTEVFVTGEYAEKVFPYCEHKVRYVPELTLTGLSCIYKNNIKDR